MNPPNQTLQLAVVWFLKCDNVTFKLGQYMGTFIACNFVSDSWINTVACTVSCLYRNHKFISPGLGVSGRGGGGWPAPQGVVGWSNPVSRLAAGKRVATSPVGVLSCDQRVLPQRAPLPQVRRITVSPGVEGVEHWALLEGGEPVVFCPGSVSMAHGQRGWKSWWEEEGGH